MNNELIKDPRILKIALAILLFLCLLPMPYGYYELVRFIMLIGFGTLAYQAKQRNNKKEMLIFVILALLFQPFLKVALGRTLWNVVDVIVGIYLILSSVEKVNNIALFERKEDYPKKQNYPDK